MEGYIQNPKTIEEAAHNIKFQCDNVSSWLYLKDYKCAKIKADCIMEAFEVLFKMIERSTCPNCAKVWDKPDQTTCECVQIYTEE